MAASGEALFCIGISETEAGSAVEPHARPAHPRRRRLPAQRVQELRDRRAQGRVPASCGAASPGSEGTKGIGAVVVDLTADGVTRRRHPREDGPARHERGRARLRRRAHRARRRAPLRRPRSNSESFKTLIGHINHERCGNAAMCIGAAQGALEYAIRYINERMVGGKPLADLQGLQWKIADMGTQLEGARLAHCSARCTSPVRTAPRPRSRPRWRRPTANLAAKFVCDEAIQLLGGYGFSREYPVERVYRDIRGLCIGAGTVEIQRNFIGTNLLKGDGAERQRLAHPARSERDPTVRADVPAPAAHASTGGPVARGTSRRSTRCSADRDAGAVRRGRRASPAGCARWASAAATSSRGRLPNCAEAVLALPRVLAARRDRRRRSTTSRARPRSSGCSRVLDPAVVRSSRRAPLPRRALADRRVTGRARGRPTSRSCSSPADRAASPRRVLHTHRGLAHKALDDGAASTGSGADDVGPDARAARAHLRPAERRARPRRGRDAHGASWRDGIPERALQLIETRARSPS